MFNWRFQILKYLGESSKMKGNNMIHVFIESCQMTMNL